MARCGQCFSRYKWSFKKTKSHIKFDDNEINLGEKFFIDNKINKSTLFLLETQSIEKINSIVLIEIVI